MGAQNVFQRVEKKYRMDRAQYEAFLDRAKEKICEDQYGLHTIHNIYYDTQDFELIRNSLEKPKYKEKFRVRGYGNITKESSVFLEIKKKYQGIVYKRRAILSMDEAYEYLEHRVMPKSGGQIMREIDYFMKFYHPQPKVYLAYDRVAYLGREDKELRITIDRNIRSRYHRLELGYDGECEVLDPDGYLMEIKVPMAYPVWLAELLCELEIYPISFSKYGTVYTNSVLSGVLQEQKISEETAGQSTGEGTVIGDRKDGRGDARGGMAGENQGAMLTINGGTLYVNAGGDGLDANGDIMIAGGNVTVHGPENSGNGTLDYASECKITGGTFFGVGSMGMVQNPSGDSTQPIIYCQGMQQSAAAGTAIVVKDSSGETIAEVVTEKTVQWYAVSLPEFKVGETYTVCVGDTETEITLNGILTPVG